MVANGYSDTRPLVPPTDPNSISVNRRVDVVVLSDASAEAKELLPGLDAATTAGGTTAAGTPQEETHG
jgi:chemotaxis protein MotB